MWGLQRIVIAQHQRGIELKDGRLVAILGPGVYHRWTGKDRVRVLVEDISQPEVNFPHAEVYLRDCPQHLAGHVDEVVMGATEVGLVYKADRLSGLLRPGTRQLYWTGSLPVRVERIDVVAQPALSHDLIRLLRTINGVALARELAQVLVQREIASHETGVLVRDGEVRCLLAPGVHAYWSLAGSVKIDVLDLRAQTVEVSGQEILTKDKVSLRANLSAGYRITDPLLARSKVSDIEQHLYRALQFALRQAMGTRTLDELLGAKDELDTVVAREVVARVQDVGIEVLGVGVKDIILPGEMREILNQVVQAEKQALANVIRRREETAATRSLLNTAKLMETSPTLLRLKELEALERVSERIGSLTVVGGLEQVLHQLPRLGS